MSKVSTLTMHFAYLIVAGSFLITNASVGAADSSELMPPTAQAIRAFLKKHTEIKSLDDFIAYLPVEYKSNFTLVEKSQSIQDATPEYPRVIMFGSNAKIILAVSGDPKGQSFGTLEVIELPDSSTGVSKMSSIEFPDYKADFHTNRISCVSCHGKEKMPIWDQYPGWSGTVGEFDDLPRNAFAFHDLKRRAKEDGLAIYRHLNFGADAPGGNVSFSVGTQGVKC